MRNSTILALGLLVVGGCSPVMEATRPNPVDLSDVTVGSKRIDVVSKLGAPEATVKDGDNACDIYKLYTHGPNGIERAGVAVFEGAADVFTIGLAEILFFPTEIATKNEKHTVTMCYDGNNVLTSGKESD